MPKYFEQKEAAELPEKSGEYLTNKGLLFFTKAGTAENINSYWMCAGDIEWWLLPVEIKESNTAALREENEELKVRMSFFARVGKEDAVIQLKLEQQVKTLTEALESIQNSPIPANEREVESWVFTCRQIVGTTLQSLTK